MGHSGNVYQAMMNSQQTSGYNPTGANPSLNRTPSQTPMPIPNAQWQNNQTINMPRQPQTQYNQVSSNVTNRE